MNNTVRFAPRFISRVRQRGMTLLELMIAMTIGLFLIGGLLAVYVGTNQSYRVSQATSRLQENARFAFDVLAMDIRMAGYMGCPGFSDVTPNVIAAGAPAFSAMTALQGFESSAPSGITTAIANTDAITIQKASNMESLNLTGNLTAVNANIQIGGNPFGFVANDILFITDCKHADLFCANSVSTGNITISHSSACNSSNNLSYAYGPDAMVMAFEQNTYFIANNPSGQPALYRRPWNGNAVGTSEEVVEGVENMQIEYGEDTNADRVVDVYRTANAVAAWNNVYSVRVSLLMRTTDDGIASAVQPYTYNGATVTPTDRRIRRVFTSTIGLRNRLP